MKEIYIKPEIELVKFAVSDIVTTSVEQEIDGDTD